MLEERAMSLQDNKKGVSEIIGYMLLVVFGIVIGAIVFVWLRSYAPTEALNCPDGTSILMKGLSYNNTTLQLSLTTKNNGQFDIGGYFIHASNNSGQTLETIDISTYLNESYGGKKLGNAVLFSVNGLNSNSLSPGNEKTNIFDIPTEIGKPYSITVIPTRFQVDNNNRQRFVSCSGAVVKQIITAPSICIPNCSGKVCGPDGCGSYCPTFNNDCGTGFFCDAIGQCISTNCIPVADPCGTQKCGTAANGSCGQVNCPIGTNGTCQSGFSCIVGQCISNCGNGIINSGEACDDGGTVPGDGCSSSCQVEGGWICQGQPSTCLQGGAGGSFNSCGDYCDTFTGYSNAFSCVQNSNQCAPSKVYIGNISGANATYGNSLCSGGNADTCCCTPG